MGMTLSDDVQAIERYVCQALAGFNLMIYMIIFINPEKIMQLPAQDLTNAPFNLAHIFAPLW
ncbi:hypothetical protein [Pseudomonas psychrophila]|uniref:hypothetical protein n=1 Tax=Pseudomonas psychrophila TaxID=122355 RepID=UPI0012FE3F07|nr:hypothetical protein [Pseudomonas psychrophila]